MIANVHEAKSQLSKLLDAVERGEEVFVARRGKGVNRFQIVAVPEHDWSHAFGALKGAIGFSQDYDTADAEILRSFDESTSADE
jgi:antitoxin (DNA-binding transcriptional repressor) of toxin-antitoxin stability system